MKKVAMITGLFISFFMLHSIQAMLDPYQDAQEVILGNITVEDYLDSVALSDARIKEMLSILQRSSPERYKSLVYTVKQCITSSANMPFELATYSLATSIKMMVTKIYRDYIAHLQSVFMNKDFKNMR